MTIEWMLEGDAAVRWQVLRDLLDAPEDVVAGEQARVATTGWGARLLALQDPEGTWAHALYSPKWTSTTYTLLLLRQLGLPADHPQAGMACEVLLDGAHYFDGGLNFAKTVREPETCITAMVVSLATTFETVDGRVEAALSWLLDQQLDDGGWNCETIRSGSCHGSFNTTIAALEALHTWTVRAGPDGAVQDAARRGREFFAVHGLYRSHRTGEVVDPAFTRLVFPPGGVTMCCEGWTTSRKPLPRPTRGSAMRSPCCGPSVGRTAPGGPTPPMPAVTGSGSSPPGRRAASTRCEHYAFCGGGTEPIDRFGIQVRRRLTSRVPVESQ